MFALSRRTEDVREFVDHVSEGGSFFGISAPDECSQPSSQYIISVESLGKL